MSYLLSIVVPTKNRYKYLKHLIEMLRDFNTNNLELVVNDNTENNQEIVEFVDSIDFPHLKYNHVIEHLSVSQNADMAIRFSTGRYVCFIGDDDGVFPEIMECVKEAESKGVEAILSKVVKYNWPDYIDNSRYHISGVVLEEISKRKEGFINVKEELNRVIDSGFVSLGMLPKVYQGIISRNLLDRIYDKCGTYFPGPSPDMANAVALALLTDKVYYYNRNLVITGQCRSVGGGERLLKGVLPKISEVPHFSQADVDAWDSKLPDLWCAETVWPTSGIQAMKQLGYDHKVAYNKIYARFIYKHKLYASVINQFSHNKIYISTLKMKYWMKDLHEALCCRISYALSNHTIINKNKVHRNIETIKDVITI